jgi:hypothetical protein
MRVEDWNLLFGGGGLSSRRRTTRKEDEEERTLPIALLLDYFTALTTKLKDKSVCQRGVIDCFVAP